MYSIVDIETTGGHAGTGFITEVAIILHNGMDAEYRYQTLVNPGMPIPRYVQSLTGITDEMVASAPDFSDVAEEIFKHLEGRIFVAHNVNFDYSFLKHHLALAGYTFDASKLCTVRLSKKIFPGYQSYSLGNICRSLEIPLYSRHRAMGDAEATAKLFTRLVSADQQGHIHSMLRKGSKESYLPMHLSVTDVEQLPRLPGVYYFHDEKDIIVYVGNICRSLEIPLYSRHRAMGDAEATAKLFTRLVSADQQGHIHAMLRKGSKESYLPMHLSVTDVEQLPRLPGVYYFHDEKDSIIYVGKAKDLKKRVTSHFSNNSVSRRKQELIRNVHRISYSLTGSEFAAIVMESIEIRKHWPRYNQSQKHVEFPYGIFSYEDIQGRLRLGIGRLKKHHRPHIKFGVLGDAHRELWKLVRTHKLCPSLCFLQKDGKCEGIKEGYCDGVCEGKEAPMDYNQRVMLALSQLHQDQPSFAILERGRQYGEVSCILMEDGRFYGVGFMPDLAEMPALADLKALVTPYPENEFLRSYVRQYAERNPNVTRYW